MSETEVCICANRDAAIDGYCCDCGKRVAGFPVTITVSYMLQVDDVGSMAEAEEVAYGVFSVWNSDLIEQMAVTKTLAVNGKPRVWPE